MEALVCATPIIGTDCIGLEEVLRDTPSLMLEPGNISELAQAIVAFSRDNRREQFEQYQPLAVERFHVNATAQGLRDVYRNIIR